MSDLISRVIDVHAHFTLPGMDAPHFGKWSPDIAIGFMDLHGIDLQLLGIASPMPAAESRKLNDYAAGLVAKHPRRFGLLANLPLGDRDATMSEIEYATDKLQVDGFTLPSNIHGQYWGSETFAPILAELDRRGSTILLHPAVDFPTSYPLLGRPSNLIEVAMDTARTLVDAVYAGVFRKHRNVKVIVAHAGGTLPALAPRLFDLGTLPWVPNPNAVSVDEMKRQLASLYYDVAISASTATLVALSELTSPQHILFGTDFPPAGSKAIKGNIGSLKSFGQMVDRPQLRWERIASNALDVFPSIQRRVC